MPIKLSTPPQGHRGIIDKPLACGGPAGYPKDFGKNLFQ